MMPAKRLYIIGNGFDRYHGAQSDYKHFRAYLYRQSPQTVGYFDLYFGPRSLDRSFSTPAGWWWAVQPVALRKGKYGLRYPIATWARDNLWSDFERNLSELNREKVFDVVDMQLPRVDVDDMRFSAAEFYGPIDEVADMVESCTFEMKYRFHKWINTLHYAKGFRKRMVALDRDALFLNFNYTLFLETEYGVAPENILYIHGNRKDRYGSLVLGHRADDWEAFERWRHKNRNRKRYRAVQKDAKGRYYLNDKLAYLAFFLPDDSKGNWRLPIRYYAVEHVEERLEGYYEANYKNSEAIMAQHRAFFESLSEVETVTVMGHSLSDVDMAYFERLRSSLRGNVAWEFSYHSEEDKQRIRKFCRRMRIGDDRCTLFRMEPAG